MPRYKVLKGVAHNIGHSFTSLMNYAVDDYSLGHLLRFARDSGKTTLFIDLTTGEGRPQDLLNEPISALPEWYSKMFHHMVTSSGSDMSLIRSATLTLTYNLHLSRPLRNLDVFETRYICDVSVVDVRGKVYPSHFEGWWFPERRHDERFRRKWWNPFTWSVP
jgi:hypothetical protein